MQNKVSPSLDDVCVLIGETFGEPDENGNDTSVQTEREVWCAEAPASRADQTIAGQQGFAHDTLLIVPQDDYNGETKVRYLSRTLAVYRTYPRADGLIELYAGRKAGVSGV